jgi:hypothetical protein
MPVEAASVGGFLAALNRRCCRRWSPDWCIVNHAIDPFEIATPPNLRQ